MQVWLALIVNRTAPTWRLQALPTPTGLLSARPLASCSFDLFTDGEIARFEAFVTANTDVDPAVGSIVTNVVDQAAGCLKGQLKI